MYPWFLTLPILLSACLKDETISGYLDQRTIFQLVEVNGSDFSATATISFPEQGLVRGMAPCNSYSATQTAPIPWFTPGAIRATRRACPELAQESEYFAVLSRMTLVETSGPILILRNEAGEEMVFKSSQE